MGVRKFDFAYSPLKSILLCLNCLSRFVLKVIVIVSVGVRDGVRVRVRTEYIYS